MNALPARARAAASRARPRPAHPQPPPAHAQHSVSLERLYVWQLPVRLAHWLLFFSILVLSATGYYIGRPFFGADLIMAKVRSVHLYASIVFTLSLLVRVYWAFAGNRYARWSELIPVTMERLRSFWRALLFYTFLSREPVEYEGHNGLAGLTYAVIYGVYFVMIATGLSLYTVYAPLGSPLNVFRFLIPIFGGLQIARVIHHIGMWVILIFMVAHVYFVVLYSVVEHLGIFDSILSGFKFVPRSKDEP
ncbi:MAG TPA: Ni/Fe-hydrogenase, b-type cytochrome subunit [Steroidobacteraceae bacterium]|nr:Ni/Fe-hydrogenase, b-type cytochrome subunit [Steroidobacteraceae bacterium]